MTTKRAPETPRLPAHETPDGWPYEALERGESYKGLNLVDVAFDHADGVSFAEARIVRSSLAGFQLLRLSLDDVLVQACDLSNVDWTRASARRVRVEGCRLTGAKVNQARLMLTVFRDCQGKYQQFRQTVFKDVRFEQCALVEASFEEADLRGTVFAGCDLTGASFTGAKLEGCDFRGSSLEASRIRVEELRGAIIAPHQAVALFERQTGVVIQPE
jgi:uncharacterized protein YjbI with pentapeptide repeats